MRGARWCASRRGSRAPRPRRAARRRAHCRGSRRTWRRYEPRRGAATRPPRHARTGRRTRSRARSARRRSSTATPSARCSPTRSSARSAERRPQVVTLLGPPGIGKSRLVREFTTSVAGRDDRRRRPLPLLRREHERVRARRRRARARRRRHRRAAWPSGSPTSSAASRSPTASRSRSAPADAAGRARRSSGRSGGCSSASPPTGRSSSRSTTCTGPSRGCSTSSSTSAAFADGPIVLVALARPELLEERPSWAGPEGPGVLADARAALARAHRGARRPGCSPTRRRRRARRGASSQQSEGNPLFAEQVVAFAIEQSFASVTALPSTLRALLQERIDRLSDDERDVLARAAIEGAVFHRQPLAALASDGGEGHDGATVLALMRKGFVSPARAELAGDDAFRFRHVLLHSAAYESVPKERRARLHLRFADWLEQRGRRRRTRCSATISAQAWRYAGELGDDPRCTRRARPARRRTPRAGGRGRDRAQRRARRRSRSSGRRPRCSRPARSSTSTRSSSSAPRCSPPAGSRRRRRRSPTPRRQHARAGHAPGRAHAGVLRLQVALQVDPGPALARIPGGDRAGRGHVRARRTTSSACAASSTPARSGTGSPGAARRPARPGSAPRRMRGGAPRVGAARHARVGRLVAAARARAGPKAIVRCERLREETQSHPALAGVRDAAARPAVRDERRARALARRVRGVRPAARRDGRDDPLRGARPRGGGSAARGRSGARRAPAARRLRAPRGDGRPRAALADRDPARARRRGAGPCGRGLRAQPRGRALRDPGGRLRTGHLAHGAGARARVARRAPPTPSGSRARPWSSPRARTGWSAGATRPGRSGSRCSRVEPRRRHIRHGPMRSPSTSTRERCCRWLSIRAAIDARIATRCTARTSPPHDLRR